MKFIVLAFLLLIMVSCTTNKYYYTVVQVKPTDTISAIDNRPIFERLIY